MKLLAHDQNGNKVTSRVYTLLNADGARGYARRVWAGWNPATDISWNIYRTREAARNGDISDTYRNNPDLIAIGTEGWKPTR